MRGFALLGFGWLFGFAFAIAAIAAISLAAIGVGGHVWAIHDRGVATVLVFDPGQVAVRSIGPGVVAVMLLIAIVMIARRLGRQRLS